MIKGLYITVENTNDSSSGVVKKIKMQTDAFLRNGLTVEIVSFPKNNDIKERITRFIPFYDREYVEGLIQKLQIIDLKQYRFIYIRYFLCGKDLLKMLNYIKTINSNIKIICEFPTFPYDHELLKVQFIPYLVKDILYRNKLKRYVDHTTTYSNEKEIYGIPCIELFNGYSVNNSNSIMNREKNSDTFNLIGVGNISPWHGYEKVIKGIKQYYEDSGTKHIVFHIVGGGRYTIQLKKMVKKLNIEDSIVFDGYRSGNDLLELYAISDVAVGSLNARLMRCDHISPLKTREYCAIGIPFLYTKYDYIFYENKFEFGLECNDDNDCIDIKKVIEFSENLREKYTNEQINKSMKQFVFEHLGWDKSLEPVFAYIKLNEKF